MKLPVVGPRGREHALVSNWRNHRTTLDFSANADTMSDMKTFTVRELDREPAAVLDAADKDGVVRIKRRDGRLYSLQPVAAPRKITSLPDFAARRKAIFPRTIPASRVRLADKLIAGE
ncbi:MAG: hypothetical protein DME22_04245 [Verrucomicrobia bacterium]|nr:MAG: hypothetical protein DME22_04245 [Verrucomicrobiota bacterium]